MKRLLAVLLVIQIVLLAGCTLPFIGEISPSSGEEDGQEMLTAPADSLADQADLQPGGWTGNPDDAQAGNQAGTTGSGITDGTSDGTSSAISFETTPGAFGQEDPAGISSGAAATLLPTGSAVAGEMYQYPQDAAAQDPSAQETDGIPQGEMQIGPDEASSIWAGTGGSTDITETGYPVTVYYQDGDGCLIPMTRWIEMQQGIARAAVNLCIDSAIAREEVAYYGVYPVLPAGTEILGISIRDEIATIDFNKRLLNYSDAVAERNIVAAIVYTLTEFKNVSRVCILVNGYPQEVLKYGTNLSGALGRQDVMINTGLRAGGSGQGKVDVFLLKKANEGFTYMVPVSVPVSGYAGEWEPEEQLAELLVGQLLAAGDGNGVFSELPEDVEILGCSLDNGTMAVDFTAGLTNYGGNDREESILKQLAYTVRQIDGIRRLVIKVDGKPAQLPEGTEVSSGLAIPATINDVMDR